MARALPDSLIFDFDGVVVDSYAAVTGSINAALAEHGLPTRPQEELRWCIGPPTFAAFSELTGWPGDSAELAAIIATYRRLYGEVYLAKTTAIDGIVPVLAELSTRAPLAIATSKSVTFTAPLLAELGLDGFFAFVAAAAPNDASDDKTAIVGRAIEALDVRGRHAPAMIGDRSFDVVAAHAHGLRAIGVTWGIGSVEELRDAGADMLLMAPSELLGLLAAEGDGRGEGH